MRIPMVHSRRAGFISVNQVSDIVAHSVCVGIGLEVHPLPFRADFSQPTAPQLLVNGEKDTQMPIEDLYIVLRTGTNPRQAWVNPTSGHIGRNRGLSDAPIFEGVITHWFARRLR